jgi:hypothetical protein
VHMHGYPVMNETKMKETKLMRACSLAGWQLAGAFAWLSGDERNQVPKEGGLQQGTCRQCENQCGDQCENQVATPVSERFRLHV